MKTRICAILILTILFSTLAIPARQENGINAINTGSGYILVWNQSNIHFTVEIKGKAVKPLTGSEHVFFNVDGMVISGAGRPDYQFQ